MNPLHRIQSLLLEEGNAVLYPGFGIVQMIRWDRYIDYQEIDSSHHYLWNVECSFSGELEAIRVRQTVKLYGQGVFKKHEAEFAFTIANLESVWVQDYIWKKPHPGRGPIPVEGLYSGYDQAYQRSPGTPTAVILNFKSQVNVMRWSCLPITQGVMSGEQALKDISLCLPTAQVAVAVKDAFDEMIALAASSADPNLIETPREDIESPKVFKPGEIWRD